MSKPSLVCVVEDDPSFRDSMKRLLRSLGYDVEAFCSGGEFLVSPRRSETACLIADVQMATMTGIELHRRLAEGSDAIPTILITAFPDDRDRARALMDGVICYLRKPVDEKDLRRCIYAAFRSRELPEEEL